MNSEQKSTAESLFSRIDTMTARHSVEGKDAAQPPTIAAQSPIHEILIDEIAAALPPAVAKRLRASKSVVSAHDWIAAGAMFTWIKSDNVLAQKFLDDVGERPRTACLALAKTVARTLDPPPPDAKTLSLDRWGLLMQLAVAALLLAVRGLCFSLLFALASNSSSSLAIPHIARQIILPDLLCLGVSSLAVATVAIACAVFWLLLESLFVPRILECVRSLFLCKPHSKNWRPEALSVIWILHVLVIQAALAVRCGLAALADSQVLFDNPIVVAGVLTCLSMPPATWIALVVRARLK